jgi:hypothetical protein
VSLEIYDLDEAIRLNTEGATRPAGESGHGPSHAVTHSGSSVSLTCTVAITGAPNGSFARRSRFVSSITGAAGRGRPRCGGPAASCRSPRRSTRRPGPGPRVRSRPRSNAASASTRLAP